MERIAVYLRVSTQDQSTELQKREILQYVQSRGWGPPQIYEDKATGTNANRPMLKALLGDCRERKVDVVIAWKLDRFFRSLKDLVTTLQELTELGIDFISLKDHIDLSTSSGRLMMHMLGAFAEFEASLIRERVRAGLRNARAKGKVLGRPKERDDDRIHLLRYQGVSIKQIARELGIAKSTVQDSLRAGKPSEKLMAFRAYE